MIVYRDADFSNVVFSPKELPNPLRLSRMIASMNEGCDMDESTVSDTIIPTGTKIASDMDASVV